MIVDFDGLRKTLAHSYNAMVRKLNSHQTSDMFGKDIEIPPHEIEDDIETLRIQIQILLALQSEEMGISSLLEDIQLEKFETE